MHEGTVALLDIFVEGYMTDRRGRPTRILHIGDEGIAAIHKVFGDSDWTLTTAGRYNADDLTMQLQRSSNGPNSRRNSLMS